MIWYTFETSRICSGMLLCVVHCRNSQFEQEANVGGDSEKLGKHDWEMCRSYSNIIKFWWIGLCIYWTLLTVGIMNTTTTPHLNTIFYYFHIFTLTRWISVYTPYTRFSILWYMYSWGYSVYPLIYQVLHLLKMFHRIYQLPWCAMAMLPNVDCCWNWLLLKLQHNMLKGMDCTITMHDHRLPSIPAPWCNISKEKITSTVWQTGLHSLYMSWDHVHKGSTPWQSIWRLIGCYFQPEWIFLTVFHWLWRSNNRYKYGDARFGMPRFYMIYWYINHPGDQRFQFVPIWVSGIMPCLCSHQRSCGNSEPGAWGISHQGI
jgi:hypothetical protein